MSSAAAYLIMIVVGKLIRCDKENVHEICLDVKPKPIPLREIISRLVLGSQNIGMIGKPKFFIFIHDDVDENQVESDSSLVEEVKSFNSYFLANQTKSSLSGICCLTLNVFKNGSWTDFWDSRRYSVQIFCWKNIVLTFVKDNYRCSFKYALDNNKSRGLPHIHLCRKT
jgi:hypothetical protein